LLPGSSAPKIKIARITTAVTDLRETDMDGVVAETGRMMSLIMMTMTMYVLSYPSEISIGS
jgi:hypothetical protein